MRVYTWCSMLTYRYQFRISNSCETSKLMIKISDIILYSYTLTVNSRNYMCTFIQA